MQFIVESVIIILKLLYFVLLIKSITFEKTKQQNGKLNKERNSIVLQKITKQKIKIYYLNFISDFTSKSPKETKNKERNSIILLI